MKDYKPDMTIYEGINPQLLPREWSPFYVVYKYDFAKSTYIVGFETDVAAADFQQEVLTHKHTIRAEIYGHYPLEILKEIRNV